jgi:ABC-type branched-subunit amino acid transport system permease subunit
VLLVERSRLGRLLRAMADSPVALVTQGTNVNVTRSLVFCISSFLAGIGGAVLAPVTGFVSGTSFPFFNSLVFVAVLFVVGAGTVRAPALAALGYFVIPAYLNSATVVDALPILFGVAAIGAALHETSAINFSRIHAWLARQAETGRSRASSSPAMARLRETLPAQLHETLGVARSFESVERP